MRYVLYKGRPGTPMKAYEGDLTPTELDGLVGLMRSRAVPVDDTPALIPTTLGPVVLNQGGPEPAFTVGQRFTSVDTVYQELKRGASFGFLDARAPSDYVAGHIAGAADVPFYEAKNLAYALPKDKWLVAYCGCPHAESGALMDALLKEGFTKVTILDEGFNVWTERGYPVNVGAGP
jgi:cytochrome c oxidase cbb3-type subunit 3/ubiquinol-cytochrome c reductase cytochrome c subunit